MKLIMIDYTGFGAPNPVRHAQNVLFFAKNTRLMRSADFDALSLMTPDERAEELSYIARTIPSCWEFLHYTYVIEDVTRAFTHQLVRSRTASFAQQTMRVLPMEDFEYLEPEGIEDFSGEAVGGYWRNDPVALYRKAMEQIDGAYKRLLELGTNPEDARGILPTNILTNITMSANLRTIVELVRKRSSPRVQGEYREFIEQLQNAVQCVHPFTVDFFGLDWAALNRELEFETADLPIDQRTRIAKLFSKVTEGVSS